MSTDNERCVQCLVIYIRYLYVGLYTKIVIVLSITCQKFSGVPKTKDRYRSCKKLKILENFINYNISILHIKTD